MLAWKAEYSVDVSALDDQHKELFKLLDDLNEALAKDESVDVDFALTKMHVYMLFHFSSEEHLLAKYGFPKLDLHVEEHRKFKARVEEFKRCFSENKQMLAVEIRDYLTEWFTNHILETDKEYSAFLAPKVKQ
jgi:hemerythrin